MEPIILKENPIGEFHLEQPPPRYSNVLNCADSHDRHFIEIYLRGFLYLLLSVLISSNKTKGKKRAEILLAWISDLHGTLGLNHTEDFQDSVFRWKLMPEYSQKIIPEIKDRVLGLANEFIAEFLHIVFDILSLEDSDEKGRKKNLIIKELEDLAEKMKGKNLPPD